MMLVRSFVMVVVVAWAGQPALAQGGLYGANAGTPSGISNGCPVKLVADFSVSAARGGFHGGVISYLRQAGFKGDMQEVIAKLDVELRTALESQVGVAESLRQAAMKAEPGDARSRLTDRYEEARVKPVYDYINRVADKLHTIANPGQGRASGYTLEAIRNTLRDSVKKAVDPAADIGYRRPDF